MEVFFISKKKILITRWSQFDQDKRPQAVSFYSRKAGTKNVNIFNIMHSMILATENILPGPPVPDASTFIKAPIVSRHLWVLMKPCVPLIKHMQLSIISLRIIEGPNDIRVMKLTSYQHKKLLSTIEKKNNGPRRNPTRVDNKTRHFQHWCCIGKCTRQKVLLSHQWCKLFCSLKIYFVYPPTHEPQSPAPGESSGLSKWPFNITDASESCEFADDILPLQKVNTRWYFLKE